MTKQELNRDIRKLYKRFLDYRLKNFCDTEHEALRKELQRLYYANTSLEYLTKKSLLIMIRLNVALRVIPLHQFGSQIKLK